MKPFGYARAQDANEALTMGAIAGASFLGGGTNLVDRMSEHIAQPSELVDVSHLPNAIAPTLTGGLDIGSAATNTQIASHAIVRRDYRLLSHAILSGATSQIRNMGTAAGNPERALADADVAVGRAFTTPRHNHAAIELHATVAQR